MKLPVCLAVCALASAASALEIHVSPSAAPGGDGTIAKPFADVVSARNAVRDLRQKGNAGRIDVVLADGDYVLPDGTWFDAKDSGASASAPTSWRAEHLGKARFVGASRIAAELFKPVSDPAVRARLPEGAADRVRVVDVSPFCAGKIDDLAPSYGGTPAAPLVFADHAHGTLARWPNKDVEGKPGDVGSRGWAFFSKKIDKGGEPVTNADGKVTLTRGAFVFDNPRAARWTNGFWLNGYWTHDWANQSVKAAPFETSGSNRVVRLAAQIPYGVMGRTWGRAERRFHVFNLLEELDEPGEWFLDRGRKLLYVIPTSASGETFISFLRRPLLTVDKAKHLRFDGIRFEYGARGGVNLNRCEDVRVENCVIANFGEYGANVVGESLALRNCELFNLGTAGASLVGGDRRRLVKSGSVAEGNRVHDYAIYQRTYAAGFHVGGCGATLRANEIWNAPHSAVLYGGNEHLFESNDVHHVLLETGDAGAYYTGRDWTTQGNVLRYNFTHELGAEGKHANTMGFYFDDCDCGDEVYGNVFWRVARGIMVGGGRDHPIRDNVFAECLVGMSIDARGITWKDKWNSDTDSSWQLTKKAAAMGYTNEPWASRYPRLAKILDDFPREPLYDPVQRNVFVDCANQVIALDGAMTVDVLMRMAPISDNVLLFPRGTNSVLRAKPDQRIANGFTMFAGTPAAPETLGFADPANGDFRVKAGARVLELFPGFGAAKAVSRK